MNNMKRITYIANTCIRDCLIDIAVDDYITPIEKAAILTAVSDKLYEIREKLIYEAGNIDLWELSKQINSLLKEDIAENDRITNG